MRLRCVALVIYKGCMCSLSSQCSLSHSHSHASSDGGRAWELSCGRTGVVRTGGARPAESQVTRFRWQLAGISAEFRRENLDGQQFARLNSLALVDLGRNRTRKTWEDSWTRASRMRQLERLHASPAAVHPHAWRDEGRPMARSKLLRAIRSFFDVEERAVVACGWGAA